MSDDAKRAAVCTCDPKPPIREHAVLSGGLGIYATYLSVVKDDTRFDPACPFHGEHGSMVVRWNAASSEERASD